MDFQAVRLSKLSQFIDHNPSELQKLFIFESSFWFSATLDSRAESCCAKAWADTVELSLDSCLMEMASAPERLTTASAKSENFIVVVFCFLKFINYNYS